MISPSGVVLICKAATHFELTCTITIETLLQWSLSLVDNEGVSRRYARHITSIDMSQQTSQFAVNSSVFCFSRTSLQGDLPLTSSLIINPVAIELEGTMVNCIEVGNSMNNSSVAESRSAVFTIHFVQENPDSPTVTIRKKSVKVSHVLET